MSSAWYTIYDGGAVMGYVKKGTVNANDGDSKVEVKIAFQANTLTNSEVNECVKSLARGLCDVLRQNVPYSDFGPENIKITL